MYIFVVLLGKIFFTNHNTQCMISTQEHISGYECLLRNESHYLIDIFNSVTILDEQPFNDEQSLSFCYFPISRMMHQVMIRVPHWPSNKVCVNEREIVDVRQVMNDVCKSIEHRWSAPICGGAIKIDITQCVLVNGSKMHTRGIQGFQ
mmetsp:Transcript_3548/g.7207  ORF Transcript_3548/g.7207 Transcript_3548/m.7207 type:complete len:148 (+) Transcript_3548:108-551(+)